MEQQKTMNSLDNLKDEEKAEEQEEGFTFSDNKTFYKTKVNLGGISTVTHKRQTRQLAQTQQNEGPGTTSPSSTFAFFLSCFSLLCVLCSFMLSLSHTQYY